MSVLALVERLAPHIEKELNLVIKSKKEADSLSSQLKKIHGGLQDAEKEGATNTAVKVWLKQLEGVAHEMEDVLDEWEILNLQVEKEGVSLDNVRSFILSLCSCFKQVLGRRENTKKIQALSGRIDQILSERGKYNFVSENNPRSPEFRQEPSTSLVPKFGVYGRDGVKDSLVRELTKEVGEKKTPDQKKGKEDTPDQKKGEDGTPDKKKGEHDTQTVSIVGIGGLGKTTLAQMVYNDIKVEGFFDLKGWVSVPKPFDSKVVARSILEEFGEKCDNAQNLNILVQRIQKCVQNQRFLLVLDNVWEGQDWENLKICLDDGAKGSRVLVTTRFKDVAIKMGTSENNLLPLDTLSLSECSDILNGIALGGRKIGKEEHEKLRRIGVEIAKKCNGLPLAAKSLGSMLSLKSSIGEWESVLESPLWTHDDEVSDERRNIFRVLNLSYIELSPVLKRCFLSSVMFPRGTLISIDEMIRIWMAYGYLNSKANSFDEVRSKGLQYLRNLEMRSFFQKFESKKKGQHVEKYKMHDIMHEFAGHMLGNDYSFFKNGRDLRSLPPASLGKLRTVCPRYIFEEDISEEDRFPSGMLSLVKSVRVLSMRNCKLRVVPEEVGELVHLRYLDLSGNKMKELPETLCNLYFLQTLIIENCYELCSLPEGIEKLVNLRHILNSGSYKLFEYPQGLEKLIGLWTLSQYRGSKLGYLGNLNQLQGSLELDLSNLDDAEQVRKANLGNNNHVKELTLILFPRKRGIEDEAVEALQPPPNLQILDVSIASGKWLSKWMGKSFENLKIMVLYNFENSIENLGNLPALEQLEIDLPCLKCIKTRELLGQNGFPRLKKLHFSCCYEWEEWEDINEEEAADLKAMRCLQEFQITGCDKLRALPRNLLQHASSLKIIKLTDMTEGCSLMRDMDGGGLSYLPNVNCVNVTLDIASRLSVVRNLLRRQIFLIAS